MFLLTCSFPPWKKNEMTEPFRADRDHDLDLPQTGDALPRRVHDARLGRTAYLCRVASPRPRPRVPASDRTADAHPARADHLLCARHRLERDGDNDNDDDGDDGDASAAPTAPYARAGAPDVARALALGPAKRVELLVAAKAAKPGPHAVPPDRKGDGAVVEAVRRRGQVRNSHARQRIVARIVIFFPFYPPQLVSLSLPTKHPHELPVGFLI